MRRGDPLPVPRTHAGRLGLSALLRSPDRAMIALDFDGTLSPIVSNPQEARAHPAIVPAMHRLAQFIGTLAVITGRPAVVAVELGDLAAIPGLIVLGHYGEERWQEGVLNSPPPAPEIEAARAALPRLLADADAHHGTWIEDKGNAVAVHTRGAQDPAVALEALSEPLSALASKVGLAVEPGRLVMELRPHGMDKGRALKQLAAETMPGSIMFCGDDLGDLVAFEAVGKLREAGIPGLTVCSRSDETAANLMAQADLVVEGPDGISALLGGLAGAIEP